MKQQKQQFKKRETDDVLDGAVSDNNAGSIIDNVIHEEAAAMEVDGIDPQQAYTTATILTDDSGEK